MTDPKLTAEYKQLKAQAHAQLKPTAQLPRQRRGPLAMIQPLKLQTAAGDDAELHVKVKQLFTAYQKSIGLFAQN